jgi:hypothetical protein
VIEARFRPVPVWPHEPTLNRRSRWTFKASWQNTLDLLDRELRYLGAENIVIGCGLREQDIRNDGWPRSGAREPVHPGVEISFDGIPLSGSMGRLVYATDVCEKWEHNVRAIALGLESLRAVDRHGITRRGEQYAGFKALPAGSGPSAQRGKTLIARHGGVTQALKATHPDHGGDPSDFADVQAAREAA